MRLGLYMRQIVAPSSWHHLPAQRTSAIIVGMSNGAPSTMHRWRFCFMVNYALPIPRGVRQFVAFTHSSTRASIHRDLDKGPDTLNHTSR